MNELGAYIQEKGRKKDCLSESWLNFQALVIRK